MFPHIWSLYHEMGLMVRVCVSIRLIRWQWANARYWRWAWSPGRSMYWCDNPLRRVLDTSVYLYASGQNYHSSQDRCCLLSATDEQCSKLVHNYETWCCWRWWNHIYKKSIARWSDLIISTLMNTYSGMIGDAKFCSRHSIPRRMSKWLGFHNKKNDLIKHKIICLISTC